MRTGRGVLAILFLVIGIAEAALPAARRDAESSLQEGNRLYREGLHLDAWDAYREVLGAGYGSASLFFNLSNAAYRSGEPGWAIYYLEQARRRAPSDPDIAANLRLVRREAQGDLLPVEDSGLLRSLDSLTGWLTIGVAAWISLAAAWAAALVIALTWALPALEERLRGARAIAIGAFAATLLLLALGAGRQGLLAEAMVVRATAIHTEPGEETTVEFRLPPGSPVRLARRSGEWREVVVSESLRGWVPAEQVVPFDDPR